MKNEIVRKEIWLEFFVRMLFKTSFVAVGVNNFVNINRWSKKNLFLGSRNFCENIYDSTELWYILSHLSGFHHAIA